MQKKYPIYFYPFVFRLPVVPYQYRYGTIFIFYPTYGDIPSFYFVYKIICTCNPKITNLHFQPKKHPKMAAEPNNKMADPSRRDKGEFQKSVLVALSSVYEESNPLFKSLISYLHIELSLLTQK